MSEALCIARKTNTQAINEFLLLHYFATDSASSWDTFLEITYRGGRGPARVHEEKLPSLRGAKATQPHLIVDCPMSLGWIAYVLLLTCSWVQAKTDISQQFLPNRTIGTEVFVRGFSAGSFSGLSAMRLLWRFPHIQASGKLGAIACHPERFCGILWSCENPGISFKWQTTPFIDVFSTTKCMATELHHCRFGSSARKLTRLIHNIESNHRLNQLCNNQHEQEPSEQKLDGSWATAEETAYPWPP